MIRQALNQFCYAPFFLIVCLYTILYKPEISISELLVASCSSLILSYAIRMIEIGYQTDLWLQWFQRDQLNVQHFIKGRDSCNLWRRTLWRSNFQSPLYKRRFHIPKPCPGKWTYLHNRQLDQTLQRKHDKQRKLCWSQQSPRTKRNR